MILEGNQRGGARDLALHLLKEENDHVEVHHMRGFVSDELVSAFQESYAISRGTKCKQHLFSLSLNPPPNETVSTEMFERAVTRAEEKLGLQDQPRAIVFHEKEGRRHAHAVYSRIDAGKMKAIQLSHTKRKLMDVSRELFIEHKWQMPRGLMDSNERDPFNFTLAQWQQAKRAGKDPKEIKAAFQDCWAVSDGQASFASALKERGYILARGDRRGFVALDHFGEVYAVSKWAGVKAKETRAKLTAPETLPSVQEAKQDIAQKMSSHLETLKQNQDAIVQSRLAALKEEKEKLVARQRKERAALEMKQKAAQAQETKLRQKRLNKGLRGLFDRMTGKRKQTIQKNEFEAFLALKRDQKQKDALILSHLEKRRAQDNRVKRLDSFKHQSSLRLDKDIKQYQDMRDNSRDRFKREKIRNRLARDGPKLSH